MRVALIINPKAGGNRGIGAARKAQRQLAKAGWEVVRKVTEAAGDAARLARESAREGCDAVLACGGDGTLSQVLAGLLDSGVPAGLVPAGTGNDFARSIGLSRDPAAAMEQLIQGQVAAVDLLEVNDGALWCVNVLGAGFDARVTLRMNGRRPLTGGLVAYLSAVMQELFTYRATPLRVRVDGERWEGEALLAAVANARSYGAGMKIAPQAEIADGLLDVVVVEYVGRMEFLRNFPRVLQGTHLSHPAVHTWKGRAAMIEALAEPAPVLVDGDVQCETPVRVRVSPGRARMLLPRPAEGQAHAAVLTLS